MRFEQRKMTSLAADVNFYAGKTHYALGATLFSGPLTESSKWVEINESQSW